MNPFTAMKKVFLFMVSIVTFSRGKGMVADEVLRAAHIAVENRAIIIDVRTTSEYMSGHIKNSINIPLQQIEQHFKGMVSNDTEIVVYCRRGNRSQVAARYLEQKGYKVYDVATQKEWERAYRK